MSEDPDELAEAVYGMKFTASQISVPDYCYRGRRAPTARYLHTGCSVTPVKTAIPVAKEFELVTWSTVVTGGQEPHPDRLARVVGTAK